MMSSSHIIGAGRHLYHFLTAGAVSVLALLVCGCQKVLPSQELTVDRSRPVGVESFLSGGQPSKGAGEVTTASLRSRSFGLFAWWTREDSYFSGISGGSLYLDNMRMTYEGSTPSGDRWSCSTESFWPLGCNLSFFAYAPYMDCGGPMLVLPNGDPGPLPRGTFTQAGDVSAQEDLCLAAPVYDRSAEAGDVPMVFSHALTKVSFYINIEGTPDEETDFVYRVESLAIRNVAGSNSFTFGNAPQGFRWDDLPRTDLGSRDTDYTLSRLEGELVDDTLIHVSDLTDETGFDRYVRVNGTSGGQLYLLPQPMAGVSTVEVVIYGYSVDGEGTLTHRTTLDPFVIRLPEETVWGAGDEVAYTATIDITRWDAIINFNATVAPWGALEHTPVVWDNGVYVTRHDSAFSLASVGSEFSCGDLGANPPVLYINGSATAVSEWTLVNESLLTAKVATGTFSFTLTDRLPVSVSFVED